jgi:outer membrane murein-binding lipoprotein Lpp
VKKLVAAVAILAVVFVVGCQDTKKVTELQGQLDKANMQITELQGQLQTVTAEKDSLAKVLSDMAAKAPATKTVTRGGTSTGTGGGLKPPTKK